MSAETVGLRFLGSVVSKSDTQAFLKYADARACLREGPEKEVDEFVTKFMRLHGKFPALETVYEQVGVTLSAQVEPPSYYAELTKKRFVLSELRAVVVESSELLSPSNAAADPYAALDKLALKAVELRNLQMGLEVNDLRHAKDIVYQMYMDKQNQIENGTLMQMGWKSLDVMSGGIGAGDVVSIVGRPGQGKTQMMLYSALMMWEAGHTPLFVSMEMRVSKLMQRLTAMLSHTKLTNQMLGQLGKVGPSGTKTPFEKFMDTLNGLKKADHPFHLIDGNLTATVPDISDLVSQLKPSVVFVDGAYLLRHAERLDRYTRVAENCDLMKQQIAGDLATPVIPSWQFARSSLTIKKGEKVGLEHIGYSDVIGQISSLVLGLFEDETIETMIKRKVEILKGRDGQTGGFSINWDWQFMNFDEIDADKDTKMLYV